jgi:hypothetical protein
LFIAYRPLNGPCVRHYNAVHRRKLTMIDFESAIQSTLIRLNDEQSHTDLNPQSTADA